MRKKGHTDILRGQNANKPKPKQMEVETQQVIGCKMRFLVGYENKKAFATISTSKEVDYQIWCLGRNRGIKNIKTSRIIIPGMMKMMVIWFIQYQLKENVHHQSTIFELL